MKILFGVLIGVFTIAILYRLLIMILLPSAIVTSWFRTPWHNEAVGGVPYSQHQIGWAFDIRPVNPFVWNTLLKIPFGFRKNEGDHIHVQLV